MDDCEANEFEMLRYVTARELNSNGVVDGLEKLEEGKGESYQEVNNRGKQNTRPETATATPTSGTSDGRHLKVVMTPSCSVRRKQSQKTRYNDVVSLFL